MASLPPAYQDLFRIRVIACFVHLIPDQDLAPVVRDAAEFLYVAEEALTQAGYTVQTLRLVTNPFPEWLTDASTQLPMLDDLLAAHKIEFCALGCARTKEELETCEQIVAQSHRFSCSAYLYANDADFVQAIASTVASLSRLSGQDYLDNGLGNFRFCATTGSDGVPFFPAARSPAVQESGTLQFAIGLENGALANHALEQCVSIVQIPRNFAQVMTEALLPLQQLCQSIERNSQAKYIGMDTSLNPSLDEKGSVAAALEHISQVRAFPGPGTLAVTSAVTMTLQSLPNLISTGYCGLMLPLCEDLRLAALADGGKLHVNDLMRISHVCGVGIDTVPIEGDFAVDELAAILLDVAGVANRWNKTLSCRVLPMPGKKVGDKTSFDSPYLVNAQVLSLT